MKKISCLILVLVMTHFYCNNPAIDKKRPGIKYLTVNIDISDKLIICVENFFESIPTCWGCKSLSEQDWNWVPLVYRATYFIKNSGDSICVPLFINRNTICKWKYHYTNVGVCKKNDSMDVAGFLITRKRDTTLIINYAKLVDTVKFECYRLMNQYSFPKNETYVDCDQIGRDEEDPIDYYTLDSTRGDTAHITVVANYDYGPIRYLDTTLAWPNYFRVFGENEKVPGLDENVEK